MLGGFREVLCALEHLESQACEVCTMAFCLNFNYRASLDKLSWRITKPSLGRHTSAAFLGLTVPVLVAEIQLFHKVLNFIDWLSDFACQAGINAHQNLADLILSVSRTRRFESKAADFVWAWVQS